MRLNKRRTKTGIFFTDLTFRKSQHTSSEMTFLMKLRWPKTKSIFDLVYTNGNEDLMGVLT